MIFMENKNNNPKKNKEPKPSKRVFSLTWLYLLIGCGLLAVWFWDYDAIATTEIDNLQFSEMVLDKDVDKVVFVKKDERVNVFIKGKSLDSKERYKAVKENLKGPQYYLAQNDFKAFRHCRRIRCPPP